MKTPMKKFIKTHKKIGHGRYTVTYPRGTQFEGTHFFFRKKEAAQFISRWASLALPECVS